MMILSECMTKEAMIDSNTGRRFWRDLSKQEIFEVINSKIEDEYAQYKMDKLLEAGLSLEEILEFALSVEE